MLRSTNDDFPVDSIRLNIINANYYYINLFIAIIIVLFVMRRRRIEIDPFLCNTTWIFNLIVGENGPFINIY